MITRRFFGLFVLAVGSTAIANPATETQAERELKHELQLARKAGLPTTWQEFAARVPAVPKSQNAAKFYQQLDARGNARLFHSVDYQALGLPGDTPEVRKRIRQVLKSQSANFAIIDAAVRRPHCNFYRDWSLGVAVIFSEYARAKQAAKWLLLRGYLAGKEGRHTDAIADARKALVIAKHLGEEPIQISMLCSIAIQRIALYQLALQAFEHPKEKDYLEEVRRFTNRYPVPSLQRLHRFDLVEVLSAIELCHTKKGKKQLGLSEIDLDRFDGDEPVGKARTQALIAVIKASRALWTSYNLPLDQIPSQFNRAASDLSEAMVPFTLANKIYKTLCEPSGDPTQIIYIQMQDRNLYRAFIRAMSSNQIERNIITSDLLDPWTKKPLTYSFDGNMMTITTGEDGDASLQRKLRFALHLQTKKPVGNPQVSGGLSR